MAERTTRKNRREELKVKPETMTDEGDGIRKTMTDLTLEYAELRKFSDAEKQLVDAHMKETREDHACELYAFRNLFKARKRELS